MPLNIFLYCSGKSSGPCKEKKRRNKTKEAIIQAEAKVAKIEKHSSMTETLNENITSLTRVTQEGQPLCLT